MATSSPEDAAGRRPDARTPRTPAPSIEELIAGATLREPLGHADGKSGSRLERVEIDGRRYVLKVMHVDDDWIARSFGDVACRQVTVWASGLLDLVPPSIDHCVVGAARGFGRNGWGAALLLHDVGDRLVPEGDTVVPAGQHAAFVEHMAELSAAFWEWTDDVGLMPPTIRWTLCGPGALAVERARGWPNEVPRIAERGWRAFGERAPADVRATVEALRQEPDLLVSALATTPWTFVHGDWKMGNLGSQPDGRTILLDWAYPGAGPACHDLGWYLALNRARLPEPKEDVIARFRRGLEARAVGTAGWWERQLDLCLLGTLVQFGWEKALGDAGELGWWTDRAREAARRL
jgi:Phosphotransferase enzyme family